MFTREEKLLWGEGPWVDEPDIVEFTYRDIPCLIERKYHGALCGYIFIPLDHKYAQNEKWEELEVHGGVTWSDTIAPSPCVGEGNTFVIGFDCSHCGDYNPQFVFSGKQLSELIPSLKEWDEKYKDVLEGLDYNNPLNYKTVEYATKELQQLVDQVLKEEYVLEIE